MKIRIRIIDPNTVEYPDGTVVETHSRPCTLPPEEGLCWHDVLCQWVPRDVMLSPPFYVEVEEPGEGENGSDPMQSNLR